MPCKMLSMSLFIGKLYSFCAGCFKQDFNIESIFQAYTLLIKYTKSWLDAINFAELYELFLPDFDVCQVWEYFDKCTLF